MSRPEAHHKPIAWRAVFSALCAVLVGIGLARFAYAPLVPALITENWFGPAQAGYLGAANFAGYLAGAAAAGPIARFVGPRSALRLAMLLASASFFACAAPVSFLWFFASRFASGLAGGVLMVLAATTVLPLVAPERRGLASGLIFTGVGVGIAAAGTIVPLLIRAGLAETWIALGSIAFLATLAAWGGWPAPREQFVHRSSPQRSVISFKSGALTALLSLYALAAIALVPHMVFLVDYVARGLGAGLGAGSVYWVLFGLGALVGPVCAGRIGDRIGFRSALRAVLALETLAILLPATSGHPISLALSSVLVGAFVPGVVPLILGRVQELIQSNEDRRHAWAKATIAFAAGQAAGGFLFSFVFAQSGGSYPLLFCLGAGALAISFGTALGASAAPLARDTEALCDVSVLDRHHLSYPAEDRQ